MVPSHPAYLHPTAASASYAMDEEREIPRVDEGAPDGGAYDQPQLLRCLGGQALPDWQARREHLLARLGADLTVSPVHDVLEADRAEEGILPSDVGDEGALASKGAGRSGAGAGGAEGEVVREVEEVGAGEEGGGHVGLEPEDLREVHLELVGWVNGVGGGGRWGRTLMDPPT